MVKKSKTPNRGLATLRGSRGDPVYVDDGADETTRTRPPGRRLSPPPRPTTGKHLGGRPQIDPADLRSERYGMRLHPDLRTEVERLARHDGIKMAAWIEGKMIDAVNAATGSEILDRIGRYKQPVTRRRG